MKQRILRIYMDGMALHNEHYRIQHTRLLLIFPNQKKYKLIYIHELSRIALRPANPQTGEVRCANFHPQDQTIGSLNITQRTRHFLTDCQVYTFLTSWCLRGSLYGATAV
jgi:hypothetical protein